jgi:hypothetical protein
MLHKYFSGSLAYGVLGGLILGSNTGRTIVWNISRPAVMGMGGSVAVASGYAAQGIAIVAAGYSIGAVIGTGISQAVWGDEGARAALDLYSSPSKFIDKGLFSIGKNATTIYTHYR